MHIHVQYMHVHVRLKRYLYLQVCMLCIFLGTKPFFLDG